MNSLLIGVLSQPVLFVCGYLGSLVLPSRARDITGLTFWDLLAGRRGEAGAGSGSRNS